MTVRRVPSASAVKTRSSGSPPPLTGPTSSFLGRGPPRRLGPRSRQREREQREREELEAPGPPLPGGPRARPADQGRLGDDHAGADSRRREHELHLRRRLADLFVGPPGESEPPSLVDVVDPRAAPLPVGPGETAGTARPRVELDLRLEPLLEQLGTGERVPDVG